MVPTLTESKKARFITHKQDSKLYVASAKRLAKNLGLDEEILEINFSTSPTNRIEALVKVEGALTTELIPLVVLEANLCASGSNVRTFDPSFFQRHKNTFFVLFHGVNDWDLQISLENVYAPAASPKAAPIAGPGTVRERFGAWAKKYRPDIKVPDK